MDIKLLELPAEQMGRIAQVDRTEKTRAKYYACPSEDGWGMTLKRVPLSPPQESGPWTARGIARRIAEWQPQVRGGGLFVGAFRGKKLEGFAVLGCKAEDETAELCALFVDAGCRRRGVGARLLGHVEDAARRRGIRALWIASNRTESAVRFYRKHGCLLITVRDNSVIPHRKADPVFAKPL